MGLQDEVDEIVAAAFVDADGMMGVESVTYDTFGGERLTVNVNVMRNSPVEENGYIVRQLRVFLTRADVASVNVGGDRIEIAHRRGEDPRSHVVAEILEEDAGGYLLRLE